MPTPSTWEILIGHAFNLAYDIGPQLQIVDLSETPSGADLARGWAAAMGETATGRFVRALSANVVEARHEASAFCRAVADGYSAAGVGVTADALALAAHGATLQMIVPTPVAYDMDGSPLRNGASEADKKLAEFAISRDAMTLYARDGLIVSMPGVPNTIAIKSRPRSRGISRRSTSVPKMRRRASYALGERRENGSVDLPVRAGGACFRQWVGTSA